MRAGPAGLSRIASAHRPSSKRSHGGCGGDNEMNATTHIDYKALDPEAYQHLFQLSQHLHKGALGSQLIELMSLRISQINGCVFCLDMHATLLRKMGVSQRKLDTLAGWRECELFDERERATLAWAEALNAIGSAQMPEGALAAAREHFDERELSELTFAVALIRAWNMLNVGLGKSLPAA
jgi:AhpD family alkylhydroperoxidase